eukprot:TRINITY_DN1779_c0_g1_i1.p4 TRINITY_DN1779_c0_g1~~TRINITY_DN1779_c0_g1_i1.p4  ORF type:complete len:232 (-),score=17.70 TRINITY_DN1779_c0_g1_i1:336-1031(-)
MRRRYFEKTGQLFASITIVLEYERLIVQNCKGDMGLGYYSPCGVTLCWPGWIPFSISKKPDNYSPQLPSFWSMRGQLFRIVKGTWDWGITPPAVLRSVGPVGYHLVQNYTNTRLRDTFGWPQSESDLMRDYIYYMLSQRGCAEYALRHILEPMAWAKEPLEDKLTELQTPFAFIYAQNDFFTSDVALRINRKLKHQNKSTAKIEIIEDAGHIVYMQKPNEFVERVFNVCQN